jgi:hypothetical protein
MSLHQLCAVRLLRKYQVVLHTALLECSVGYISLCIQLLHWIRGNESF